MKVMILPEIICLDKNVLKKKIKMKIYFVVTDEKNLVNTNANILNKIYLD
jgi:hypothetical protein